MNFIRIFFLGSETLTDRQTKCNATHNGAHNGTSP